MGGQVFQDGLYARYESWQSGFRQVVRKDTANSVELMAFCCQECGSESEYPHGPGILPTPVLLAWIYLIDHFRIIGMYLKRADSEQ